MGSYLGGFMSVVSEFFREAINGVIDFLYNLKCRFYGHRLFHCPEGKDDVVWEKVCVRCGKVWAKEEK